MKNIDLIRQVPLFKNQEDADLQKLAAIASEQSFPASSQIFAEESAGTSFYIVRFGWICIPLCSNSVIPCRLDLYNRLLSQFNIMVTCIH